MRSKTTTTSAPWSRMVAECARLAQADVTTWSDDEVHDGLLALLAAINQATALTSLLAASFDVRELADRDGYRATRTWLTAYGRMTQGAATGWLRRGRLLRSLPEVARAATTGAVSAEQIRLIDDLVTRVGVDKVRPLDETLAILSSKAGPREMAAACERIRAYVDPNGPEPDPRAADRRGLTLSRTGSVVTIRGQLDLEGGALVKTALDAWMRPPAPGDPRTPAHRRADAFVELARQALNNGTLPTVGGVRPHLGVLITPQTLMTSPPDSSAKGGAGRAGSAAASFDRHRDEADKPPVPETPTSSSDPLAASGVPPAPEPPWLDWVGDVPVAVAQRLACDCQVWRAILDPATGLPLEVGRTHRIVPRWIRKALHARDRGCRWPGCDAPTPWTDAHHLIAWYYGGETNVDQLLLLCRHHHMLVHEGRWSIRLDRGTGEVWVTRPDGSPYELGPSLPWRPPPPSAGHSSTDTRSAA
jgi:hypothetical protein